MPLEVAHQWNDRIHREHREPREEPIVYGGVETKVEVRLVQANVALRTEVTRLIEENLHYAESPELRAAAIEYIRDSYIDEWRRDATGFAERAGQGLVAFGDTATRERFHEIVAAEFERVGDEFRALSHRRHWRGRD